MYFFRISILQNKSIKIRIGGHIMLEMILLALIIGLILALIEGLWIAVIIQLGILIAIAYFGYQSDLKDRQAKTYQSNSNNTRSIQQGNIYENNNHFFKVEAILIGINERKIDQFSTNSIDEALSRIGEINKQYGFEIKHDASNTFARFPIEFIVTTPNGVTLISNLTALYSFYKGYKKD